jgi:hypothetical protein
MTVLEMAKKYYPKLWPASRLDALVTAGRLTQAEADEVKTAAGT